MQAGADTVTYQVSYDTVAKRPDIGINCIGNVIQVIACLRHLNACEKASLGSLHQESCLFTDLAYRESTCHVGMVSFINQSCIQTYNITFVKNMIFVRDAMYDLIIHGYTDRCRVSVIIQEVGNASMGTDQFFAQVVNIQSRYSGMHCLLHLTEHISQNLTRFSHQLNFTL